MPWHSKVLRFPWTCIPSIFPNSGIPGSYQSRHTFPGEKQDLGSPMRLNRTIISCSRQALVFHPHSQAMGLPCYGISCIFPTMRTQDWGFLHVHTKNSAIVYKWQHMLFHLHSPDRLHGAFTMNVEWKHCFAIIMRGRCTHNCPDSGFVNDDWSFLWYIFSTIGEIIIDQESSSPVRRGSWYVLVLWEKTLWCPVSIWVCMMVGLKLRRSILPVVKSMWQ